MLRCLDDRHSFDFSAWLRKVSSTEYKYESPTAVLSHLFLKLHMKMLATAVSSGDPIVASPIYLYNLLLNIKNDVKKIAKIIF